MVTRNANIKKYVLYAISKDDVKLICPSPNNSSLLPFCIVPAALSFREGKKI